jgi:integrase
MATFYKRNGARGVRWTARVRVQGREATKTYGSKAAAESWARNQETAIEEGKFKPTDPRAGAIFADLVDAFLSHRRDVRKAPGKTFAHVLSRLKDKCGLEPAATLNAAYWRRYASRRMADGVASQTAVSDLAYAASVLAHARREGLIADASGPGEARLLIKGEGLRVASRQREGRINDAALDALLAACDNVTSSIPMGALVRFALATSMRRGEILKIKWSDLDEAGRVILIRGRKHPSDRERVDEVPLMPAHQVWPRWDPLAIIKAQPRAGPCIFPYQGDSVGERFEKACAIAELDGVVFHLLRHESLTRYAERGLDVLRLQLIGGHRDLRHLARYAKLNARALVME